MPIKVLMPALSPTMTEGNIARWLKKEGDKVKSGDVLAEIETDKATMEVESVDEGKLGKILVKEGAQGVKVNEPIAVILEEGEDAKALDQFLKSEAGKTAAAETERQRPEQPKPNSPRPNSPRPRRRSRPRFPPRHRRRARRVRPRPKRRRPAAACSRRRSPSASPRIAVSISRACRAAARMAASCSPTSRRRRPPAARVGASASVACSPARAPAFPPAQGRVQPLSTMRKVIAQRLTLSKQTVPHFYVTVDCEIDRLLELRAEINAIDETLKLSVNDFVIKAVALALKQVPDANASWSDEGIVFYDAADVSVAVAIPGGLITPIIKSAEKKGLAAISKEMKDLAARARDNKLKPEEFQGGTFSISNMGMFGVKDFSAIINPPQGGILAIAAGEKRPVVKDGQLAVATVMSVTLSCDHRVIDGVLGAQWLQAFKGLIEHPIKLVL